GGTFAQGGSGGAVYVDGVNQNGVNNQMSMCGCNFINNKANYQSGAVNVVFYAGKGSSMTMDKCNFENNSCRDDKGGGFYFMNGALNLSNTLFSKNASPSQGGGLWVANGTLSITNCTFEGNTAVSGNNGLGGAFALSSGSSNIMNCTFANNRAGNFASAIFNGGNTTLNNTLFYNNLVGTGSQSNPYGGAVINKNSNLNVGEGNMQFPKGFTGQFGAADDYWLTSAVSNEDAGLLPLADNGGFTKTMALPQNSSAIDKGTNQNAPNTDQRGLPRKNRPDCGAFELQ
ncbi:MAG: choice-of-anchor Q domain-containing protein, partial [Raineya sp.]